jgi:hypothetical protein
MAMAPAASSCGVSFPARPRGGAAGSVAVRAGGAKWWAPLLGWSGRVDYLEPAVAPVPVRGDDAAEAARKHFVGGMTEEKARELRARMAATESFHDAMYHSAIASRLARSA